MIIIDIECWGRGERKIWMCVEVNEDWKAVYLFASDQSMYKRNTVAVVVNHAHMEGTAHIKADMASEKPDNDNDPRYCSAQPEYSAPLHPR